MSEKKRINEIAKETGLANKDLVAKAQEMGLDVKSHSSSIDESDAKKLVAALKNGSQPAAKKPAKAAAKKSVSADNKKEAAAKADEPLTFQGKAVVIDDPVILARMKAKEDAENPGKAAPVAEKKVEKVAKSAETSAPKTTTEKKAVSAAKGPKVLQTAEEVAAAKKSQKSAAKKSAKPAAGGTVEFSRLSLKDRLKAEAEAVKSGQAQEVSKQNKPSADFDKPKPKAKPAEKKPAAAAKTAVRKTEFTNNASPQSQATGGRKNKDKDKKHTENRDNNRFGGPLRVNDNRNQVRNARNSNWNSGGKRRGRGNRGNSPAPQVERKFVELPESFEYTEGMTIAEISKRLHREPAEFIKKLFLMGVMATQNQSLDSDTIELLLMDYGITPELKVEVDNADIERLFVEDGYLKEEDMVDRPPVVTIMGHVDHGKTTLLDHLRNSRVTEGEAGGITQHIGAYQLTVQGKKITFLDTPGHEAFTSMRARGASVTDITILVVAADDGVMPQTIEAINHSKAAGVPIIVAINKIDKPGANPQRVIQELAEYGVMSTAWGGDSEFVEISAKFDQNIDSLLDTIILVAEMLELKADPKVRAIGTVLEARLDKGKGAIATLLVQQGTLHVQDPIVAGNTFGRVRAMVNDMGRREKIATPSTAVEITGLNDVPQAGDHFAVFEDEKSARSAGEERFKRAQLIQRQNTRRVSLENLFDTLKEGQVKTVDIIIKADVQGSAEALAASLQKIEVEGVKVDIVHSAVGAINESDVSLAAASNAIIIGFNVRPTADAREAAAREDVEIRLHSIIYKVIEEVETAMQGMLDPEFEEEVVGEAVVRETFVVSKVGTIAGFLVTSGKVLRDANVRVIRDAVVLFDGEINSLKHYKDDVKEVGNAQEGGLMIEGFNDIEVDDTLEVYHMVEVKR